MFEIITLCSLPMMAMTQDRVDQIELNHVYNSHGEHTFDQFIFWRHGKIVDWRMAGNRRDATDEEKAQFKEEWKKRHAYVRPHRSRGEWGRVIPRDRVRPPAPPFIPPYEGPVVQRRHGRWILLFHDNGVLRRITADAYTVTWTQHDVEVERRKINKMEDRPKLSR